MIRLDNCNRMLSSSSFVRYGRWDFHRRFAHKAIRCQVLICVYKLSFILSYSISIISQLPKCTAIPKPTKQKRRHQKQKCSMCISVSWCGTRELDKYAWTRYTHREREKVRQTHSIRIQSWWHSLVFIAFNGSTFSKPARPLLIFY